MTPTPFIPTYLPETPSQTAGPYVHIGIIPAQAGFEIFDNNFSGDIAGSEVAGQRITIEGRIFDGAGRAQTDGAGYYKFITIKPGAYPWGNHHNAWRPAHIHFSVFGHAFISRLVTQMYFPGDPLFEFDPIFNSVPDEKARMRMVSSFDMENTQPEWALCYRFNIVLRGRNATPLETK